MISICIFFLNYGIYVLLDIDFEFVKFFKCDFYDIFLVSMDLDLVIIWFMFICYYKIRLKNYFIIKIW